MLFSPLRGLRLMLLLGVIIMFVASCSSISQSTPHDTGMSPRSYDYTPKLNELVDKKKSDSTTISSSQTSLLSQDTNTFLLDQPFDRRELQLKGITLDNTSADIIQKWGDPLSDTIMDDHEPILVMEYNGFSVGCNQEGQVVFVEVSSPVISSGIEGLQVGGQGEIVKQSLGDPDQDSGYVWRYITDYASLRLDLDPKSSIIQSIKLLPYHDKNT